MVVYLPPLHLFPSETPSTQVSSLHTPPLEMPPCETPLILHVKEEVQVSSEEGEINSFSSIISVNNGWLQPDLGKPTYTLYWMTEPFLPRNECMCWFTPTTVAHFSKEPVYVNGSRKLVSQWKKQKAAFNVCLPQGARRFQGQSNFIFWANLFNSHQKAWFKPFQNNLLHRIQ